MNFRQQLRSARAWWVGLGLVLCCLMIGSLASSGVVFAVDPCTGSATCLNVSIANSISLDLKPVSNSGTFASSSTTDNTISVTTNYFSGYKLSIAASTANDNALKYEENNVVLATIPSHNIAAGISANNYADDTYASTNHLNNTWGYRPSKLNSTDNTNYLPGPTSITDTTLDSTTTANPTTANNYNIAIGARVDMTTPKGLYANTFVIKVVANPIPYAITYNKNTEDTVTNMPANVNTTTMDTSVTVGSAPSRSGYNFVGWCTSAIADGGTCDSPNTQYAAGGSYAIDQVNGGNNLTLYAVWKKPTLYETVAAMSKGKQTNDTNDTTGTQAAIRIPTSADRTQDTSNSGVYEYDPSVFGAASDAANTSTIYYYRGVLENTVGTYGSDGSAATYPNYVILSSANSVSELAKNHTSDTCWRIVRTTGSGGVKMIYNGTWTGSTCANVTTSAQLAYTQAFGLKGNSAQSSNWYKNINRVGYTFNNTQSLQDSTTATSVDTVFGSDANPSLNNARSGIKAYIEDTWYASNMTSYTSILEPSAGYCNDRTAYSNDTTATTLTTIAPYKTSGATMYFGAYGRNLNATNAGKTPSLTCPRSMVDLYRYVANSTGVSNELKYPAALLTADEASFAGSGSPTATQGSAYNANSYLRSGSSFWLLSPYGRSSYGGASEFYLDSDGYLYFSSVSFTYGVRPAISLTSGTSAVDGIGTATNPWIVNPPPSS